MEEKKSFLTQKIDIKSPNKNIVPITTSVGSDGKLIIGGCSIEDLVKKYEVDCIYHLEDTTSEELKQLENIKMKLPEDTKIKSYWGNTLFHIDDLPFKVDKTPDVFSFFRKSLYSCKTREELNLNLTND